MTQEQGGFLSHVRNIFKPVRSHKYQKPLYHPLNHARSEIRLLQVRRRPRHEPLSFQFMNVSLLYQPLYFALSYVWGDPSITEDVTVNGTTLPVTKNLANALGYIGENMEKLYPGVDFIWLWVDAICINQTDVEEKNAQVQLMRSIYNHAKVVLSWLGVGADGMPLPIDKIKTIASRIKTPRRPAATNDYSWLENYAEYCDNHLFQAFEEELKRVLHHEYWGRVWILQELALAWHVVIMSGPEIIEGGDVSTFLAWLSHLPSAQPVKPSRVDPVVWRSLTDPMHLRFADLYPHFRMGIEGLRDFPHQEINVLSRTIKLQATDPRDKIYGLQGIFPMGVVVDYEKGIKDVYFDVAKRGIEVGSVHPLLCRAGVGLQWEWGNPFDLPSWVPDWHTLSLFPKATDHYRETLFALEAARPEDAVQFPHFPPRFTAENNLLLRGAIFDSIVPTESNFVGPYKNIRDIGSFCVNFAQLDNDPNRESYPTKIPRLQVVFRLIQASTIPSGENSGVYELCQGFLYALAHLDLPFPDRHAELLRWSSDRVERLSLLTGLRTDEMFSESLQELVLGNALPCPVEWRGLPAIEALNHGAGHYRILKWSLLRMCFDMLICRRIFHTSRGYLGVGPLGTRDGDDVVSLSGVPWPAVVRKKGSCYQLVGLCCVVDIMSSKFWDTWRKAIDSGKNIDLIELC